MQPLPPHAVLEGTMQRSHVIVVTMDGKRFSCPRDPLASASLTLRELFQFQQSQTPPSSSSTQSTTTTTTTMASQTAVNGTSSSGSSGGGATAVALPNNNNNNNSAMNDLLETTAMPELPLHNIDSHTFVSVYEYIHQKHAASSTGGAAGSGKAAGKQGQTGGSSSSGGSASASSSSLERPLRGDLATVLEPWDWKYCVDTLLKGWTPPAPAAMAAFAMAAASGNGGDRLAASTTSSTPPPTGGRTPSSSSAAATDPTPSNNNNNSNNNNAAVVSAALAFGPMSSAAMMNVFHVMNAANTLEIGPLRELCGALIAHCVRNRSEEDILHLFGVTDGSFTKEAEEALCNEFPWLKE